MGWPPNGQRSARPSLGNDDLPQVDRVYRLGGGPREPLIARSLAHRVTAVVY